MGIKGVGPATVNRVMDAYKSVEASGGFDNFAHMASEVFGVDINKPLSETRVITRPEVKDGRFTEASKKQLSIDAEMSPSWPKALQNLYQNESLLPIYKNSFNRLLTENVKQVGQISAIFKDPKFVDSYGSSLANYVTTVAANPAGHTPALTQLRSLPDNHPLRQFVNYNLREFTGDDFDFIVHSCMKAFKDNRDSLISSWMTDPENWEMYGLGKLGQKRSLSEFSEEQIESLGEVITLENLHDEYLDLWESYYNENPLSFERIRLKGHGSTDGKQGLTFNTSRISSNHLLGNRFDRARIEPDGSFTSLDDSHEIADRVTMHESLDKDTGEYNLYPVRHGEVSAESFLPQNMARALLDRTHNLKPQVEMPSLMKELRAIVSNDLDAIYGDRARFLISRLVGYGDQISAIRTSDDTPSENLIRYMLAREYANTYNQNLMAKRFRGLDDWTSKIGLKYEEEDWLLKPSDIHKSSKETLLTWDDIEKGVDEDFPPVKEFKEFGIPTNRLDDGRFKWVGRSSGEVGRHLVINTNSELIDTVTGKPVNPSSASGAVIVKPFNFNDWKKAKEIEFSNNARNWNSRGVARNVVTEEDVTANDLMLGGNYSYVDHAADTRSGNKVQGRPINIRKVVTNPETQVGAGVFDAIAEFQVRKRADGREIDLFGVTKKDENIAVHAENNLNISALNSAEDEGWYRTQEYAVNKISLDERKQEYGEAPRLYLDEKGNPIDETQIIRESKEASQEKVSEAAQWRQRMTAQAEKVYNDSDALILIRDRDRDGIFAPHKEIGDPEGDAGKNRYRSNILAQPKIYGKKSKPILVLDVKDLISNSTDEIRMEKISKQIAEWIGEVNNTLEHGVSSLGVFDETSVGRNRSLSTPEDNLNTNQAASMIFQKLFAGADADTGYRLRTSWLKPDVRSGAVANPESQLVLNRHKGHEGNGNKAVDPSEVVKRFNRKGGFDPDRKVIKANKVEGYKIDVGRVKEDGTTNHLIVRPTMDMSIDAVYNLIIKGWEGDKGLQALSEEARAKGTASNLVDMDNGYVSLKKKSGQGMWGKLEALEYINNKELDGTGPSTVVDGDIQAVSQTRRRMVHMGNESPMSVEFEQDHDVVHKDTRTSSKIMEDLKSDPSAGPVSGTSQGVNYNQLSHAERVSAYNELYRIYFEDNQDEINAYIDFLKGEEVKPIVDHYASLARFSDKNGLIPNMDRGANPASAIAALINSQPRYISELSGSGMQVGSKSAEFNKMREDYYQRIKEAQKLLNGRRSSQVDNWMQMKSYLLKKKASLASYDSDLFEMDLPRRRTVEGTGKLAKGEKLTQDDWILLGHDEELKELTDQLIMLDEVKPSRYSFDDGDLKPVELTGQQMEQRIEKISESLNSDPMKQARKQIKIDFNNRFSFSEMINHQIDKAERLNWIKGIGTSQRSYHHAYAKAMDAIEYVIQRMPKDIAGQMSVEDDITPLVNIMLDGNLYKELRVQAAELLSEHKSISDNVDQVISNSIDKVNDPFTRQLVRTYMDNTLESGSMAVAEQQSVRGALEESLRSDAEGLVMGLPDLSHAMESQINKMDVMSYWQHRFHNVSNKYLHDVTSILNESRSLDRSFEALRSMVADSPNATVEALLTLAREDNNVGLSAHHFLTSEMDAGNRQAIKEFNRRELEARKSLREEEWMQRSDGPDIPDESYVDVAPMEGTAGGLLSDVIHLKNGSLVKGLIIENVPNKRVKIETPDGNILAYDMSEVEKMTKGPGDMSNIEPRVRGINKDGDEIRSTHLVQRQQILNMSDMKPRDYAVNRQDSRFIGIDNELDQSAYTNQRYDMDRSPRLPFPKGDKYSSGALAERIGSFKSTVTDIVNDMGVDVREPQGMWGNRNMGVLVEELDTLSDETGVTKVYSNKIPELSDAVDNIESSKYFDQELNPVSVDDDLEPVIDFTESEVQEVDVEGQGSDIVAPPPNSGEWDVDSYNQQVMNNEDIQDLVSRMEEYVIANNGNLPSAWEDIAEGQGRGEFDYFTTRLKEMRAQASQQQQQTPLSSRVNVGNDVNLSQQSSKPSFSREHIPAFRTESENLSHWLGQQGVTREQKFVYDSSDLERLTGVEAPAKKAPVSATDLNLDMFNFLRSKMDATAETVEDLGRVPVKTPVSDLPVALRGGSTPPSGSGGSPPPPPPSGPTPPSDPVDNVSKKGRDYLMVDGEMWAQPDFNGNDPFKFSRDGETLWFDPVTRRYIERMYELMNDKTAMQNMLGLYDEFHSLFKATTLFPFASYHLKNVVDGMFWRNQLAGMRDGESYGYAKKVMDLHYTDDVNEFDKLSGEIGQWHGHRPADIIEAALRDKVISAEFAYEQVAEGAGDSMKRNSIIQNFADTLGMDINKSLKGSASRMSENISQKVKRFDDWLYKDSKSKAGTSAKSLAKAAVGKEGYFRGLPGMKLGFKVNDYNESAMRLSLMLDRLAKGDSMEAATDMVKAVHFDYDDLSPIERNVMKRLVSFYTFARKNLPLHLKLRYGGAHRRFKPMSAIVKQFNNTGDGSDPDVKRYMEEYLKKDVPLHIWKHKNGDHSYFILNRWISDVDINDIDSAEELESLAAWSLSGMVRPLAESLLNKRIRKIGDVFREPMPKDRIAEYDGQTTSYMGVRVNNRIAHTWNAIRYFRELNNLNPLGAFGSPADTFDRESRPEYSVFGSDPTGRRQSPSAFDRGLMFFIGKTLYRIDPETQKQIKMSRNGLRAIMPDDVADNIYEINDLVPTYQVPKYAIKKHQYDKLRKKYRGRMMKVDPRRSPKLYEELSVQARLAGIQ